jgi:hypothetical protein
VEAATIEGDRASVAKELSPVQSQSPQQHAHLFADPNASGDAVKTIGISSHRHNSSSVHSPSSQQQQLSPQAAAAPAAAAAAASAAAAAAVADISNGNSISSDEAPSTSESGSAAVGACTGDNSAAAGAGATGATAAESVVTDATGATATTGSDSVSGSSASSSSKAVKGSLWIRAKTGPLKGQVNFNPLNFCDATVQAVALHLLGCVVRYLLAGHCMLHFALVTQCRCCVLLCTS